MTARHFAKKIGTDKKFRARFYKEPEKVLKEMDLSLEEFVCAEAEGLQDSYVEILACAGAKRSQPW